MLITDTILRSQEDRSINVVHDAPDEGMIEARFVQRTEDTVIVYLSSSTGCDKACRFCHLTQTGQTSMGAVDPNGYCDQARKVLELVNRDAMLDGVEIVHFNFMARGDALANSQFVYYTKEVIEGLADIAAHYGLAPKFKISTIFPQSTIFGPDYKDLYCWVHDTLDLHPEIEFYYSLYSLNPAFRKRWIPKAMDPELIGTIFAGTKGRLRLHHALIAGENSRFEDAIGLLRWLERYKISARFNIVRYNPFSEACGQEASPQAMVDYELIMASNPWVIDTHVISRVGHDVRASCGQFIEKGYTLSAKME